MTLARSRRLAATSLAGLLALALSGAPAALADDNDDKQPEKPESGQQAEKPDADEQGEKADHDKKAGGEQGNSAAHRQDEKKKAEHKKAKKAKRAKTNGQHRAKGHAKADASQG